MAITVITKTITITIAITYTEVKYKKKTRQLILNVKKLLYDIKKLMIIILLQNIDENNYNCNYIKTILLPLLSNRHIKH